LTTHRAPLVEHPRIVRYEKHLFRPESDAAYCSNCGRYLRDRCADCGAPVEELDARFCVGCGNRLLTAS